MSPVSLTPSRREIDHRTIKLIVGVIALSLAVLTRLFAGPSLTSISASYWAGGWAQSIFIGFLFAIAAFLLAYNGRSTPEMILSKIAAIAGLAVASFPCGCDGHAVRVPYVHFPAAGVMFVILAVFCFIFYRQARSKRWREAQVRAGLYAACGAVILFSIAILGVDFLAGSPLEKHIPDLTFYGEAAGLMAFGTSWLTASRVLPGLTRPEERFSPLRAKNPE